jgi:putative transposase
VTTTVLQAYRFALDPTPTQEAALRSHRGPQWYAFTWGLALVTANLGQRQAETSYRIPVDELTPAVPFSAYSPRKLLEPGQRRDSAVVA